MKPPIQRLESHITDLRRAAEKISVFAQDWRDEAPDDSSVETLFGAYSAISDIANELDVWTDEG